MPVPPRRERSEDSPAEPSETNDQASPEPSDAPTELALPSPSQIAAAAWSEAEVATARKACRDVFTRIKAAHKPLAPIRDGICGAPAPIELSRIGADPGVEISPPATVTCPLTEALVRWFAEVVQPAARAHLNAKVLGVRNAASYVCRRRYNAANTRVSEHAYANALDIGAFVLDNEDQVILIDHWNDETGKGAFLKAVHEGACALFGTVLGPDANNAHKSHFHLDLHPRKRSNYCE